MISRRNPETLPKHLHAAYDWIDSAGEWDDAMSTRGYAVEAAENAKEHGVTDVTESDLDEVIAWKRSRSRKRNPSIDQSLTYAIDDGDSQRITAGLQGHEAMRVAKRIANERGETVYLYAMDGGDYISVDPSSKRNLDVDALYRRLTSGGRR